MEEMEEVLAKLGKLEKMVQQQEALHKVQDILLVEQVVQQEKLLI